MLKAIHGNMLPTLLDIKTKDGKQVFYGRVTIRDGSFINTDNAKVQFTKDEINNRYICEIEVQ
jgi:hypothetical protein